MDSSFRRTLGYWARVFDSQDEAEKAIVPGPKDRGVAVEDYRQRVSSAMWGTPDTIEAKLLA